MSAEWEGSRTGHHQSNRNRSVHCHGLGRIGSTFGGSLLMIIGLLFLLYNIGFLSMIGQIFWPLLLIGFGLVQLIRVIQSRA